MTWSSASHVPLCSAHWPALLTGVVLHMRNKDYLHRIPVHISHQLTMPSVSGMTWSSPWHESLCSARRPVLLTWYCLVSVVGQVGMLVLSTGTH